MQAPPAATPIAVKHPLPPEMTCVFTIFLFLVLYAPQLCFILCFQSFCLMHTGKPTGVAVSHCITWFQTQLILTTCQIRYHSHLWDHRRTGQLWILIPRDCLEYHTVSRL